MSKAVNRLKTLKKVNEKIQHGKLRTNIPAGMAAAGPPLGPMLGQVSSYRLSKSLNQTCNSGLTLSPSERRT